MILIYFNKRGLESNWYTAALKICLNSLIADFWFNSCNGGMIGFNLAVMMLKLFIILLLVISGTF